MRKSAYLCSIINGGRTNETSYNTFNMVCSHAADNVLSRNNCRAYPNSGNVSVDIASVEVKNQRKKFFRVAPASARGLHPDTPVPLFGLQPLDFSGGCFCLPANTKVKYKENTHRI